MKTIRTLSLLGVVLVSAFAGQNANSEVAVVAASPAIPNAWTENYASALKQAKNEHKRILLFFTGSDWCSWCKKLDQEILSTPEFKAFATENLILVKLDFPRHTPQSAQLQTQNRKLADKHNIDLYPTLIVLDSSGKRIGKLGYMEGGPAGFLEKLKLF